MNIRIICIGDELLSGDTINTNLATVGDILAQNGLSISGEQCAPDDHDSIVNALNSADGAEVVIIIGGLGPTKDDLTRPVTAEYLHRPLHLDQTIRQHIANYLGQRARTMPSDAIDTQAQVPEGAEILPNDNGTAPGLLMISPTTLWALLPGPPREMKPMFENYLLPRILEREEKHLEVLTVRICGLPESRVEAGADKAIAGIPGLHFAICLKNDCIMIRLTTPESQDSHARLERARKALSDEFGFRLMPPDCITAAQYLGKILLAKGLVMATAESCTGGGIAHALTAIPGSSEWFVGGMVTYANEWKHNYLGVKNKTLETYGAISEETVHEMLNGLCIRCGVPAGVAVSGIAGPGGGTPEKPVGTVVIGAFAPGWRSVRTMHYNGLRDTVRLRSASSCINLLLEGLLAPKDDESKGNGQIH